MKSNRKPHGPLAIAEEGATTTETMAYDKRIKMRLAQKQRSKQARKLQYRLRKK